MTFWHSGDFASPFYLSGIVHCYSNKFSDELQKGDEWLKMFNDLSFNVYDIEFYVKQFSGFYVN